MVNHTNILTTEHHLLFYLNERLSCRLRTRLQMAHQYNLGPQRLKYHLYPQIQDRFQHWEPMEVEQTLTRAFWKEWGLFYRDSRGVQEPVVTYLSSTPRAIERHTTLQGMSLRKKRLTPSGSFFGWKWETQELSKHDQGHEMGVVGTPHDGNLITRCFGAYFDFTQLHCRKVLTGDTVSQWSNRLTSELRLEVNISLFGNVCNM